MAEWSKAHHLENLVFVMFRGSSPIMTICICHSNLILTRRFSIGFLTALKSKSYRKHNLQELEKGI